VAGILGQSDNGDGHDEEAEGEKAGKLEFSGMKTFRGNPAQAKEKHLISFLGKAKLTA
jgi:hypothetical protein